MLYCKSFVFNPFQENTYVLCTEKGSCVLIDPGCSTPEEQDVLDSFIVQTNLKPVAIWLTHTHVDHVLGLAWCRTRWQIPFFMHPLEVPQLKAVELYAPNYGFYDYQASEPQAFFDLEKELLMGDERFQILFVPGHAPGHVAFFHPVSRQVWAGDVLFRESIGRTDLPGGDFSILEQSIRNKLYLLPDSTTVYPGHGPATTIGHEKQHNPFVRQ